MRKQQGNLPLKHPRTGRPLCPKCKQRYMNKGNKTPGGAQRWECRETAGDRKTCYSTTDPTAPCRGQSGKPREGDKNLQYRRALGTCKRFVITTAQNATPVHRPFFESLKQYAKFNEAELIVIPIRYKNATSQWTASQANAEHWLRDIGREEAEADLQKRGRNIKLVKFSEMEALIQEKVGNYLYNQRKKLNDNLVLMADIKTIPTATKPLSAFESQSDGMSGILGHTKLQLKTVPTPQGRYPIILTTTGACTVKNYTDSKAGKKGEFHHTLGACAVDIVGKKFFMRQINATKDGEFIDLDNEYTPEGIYEAPPALALVFGDTHRKFIDKAVEKVTFEPGGMVDRLDPQNLVFHDLHDGYARNPHHRNNVFSEIAKRSKDMHRVEKEVMEDIEWLRQAVGVRQGVVVPSNHTSFFERWIMDTDWRRDPDNAAFYLDTAKVMVDSTRMTKSGLDYVDPFIYWVDKLKGTSPIKCLVRDESFMLASVELSLHGDQGPNGVKGSRENLRRIGVKTIIGHSHSPGIEEGCYQTGTSTPLKLEYNEGPSSWLQCHVVLYANGKRSLLPIVDGEWCFE